MVTKKRMTAATARQFFSYAPGTGILVWKYHPNTIITSRQVGKPAGFSMPSGYRRVIVGKISYGAHRIIWLLQTGKWPKNEIDHINGDKSDNRWSNLREATRTQNRWNVRPYKSNTSGLKGASFQHTSGRWIASIQSYGVRKHIGIFNTPQEAHNAYCKVAKKVCGSFFRKG